MVKAQQIFTAVAIAITGVLALAPLFGFAIPETIWGMCVGTISAIAGNAIASSIDKAEIKLPKDWKIEEFRVKAREAS